MSSPPETAVELRPTGSKLDLIQAAALAISRFGLSALTSARIATAAGHTAASINFHFGSKEALLLATLREVSDEFADGMAQVLARSDDDALQGLLGIIDASLSAPLSESHKIAVWYAFLGESNARADYQRICGARDQSYGQLMAALCTRVIAAHGASKWPDAEAVSVGLIGLIDQLWQSILFEGDAFDREAGKRQCRAYLCSVFPWLAERIEAGDVPRADVPSPALAPASVEHVAATEPGLRYTLPAWVYQNEEFHELEKEHVFLPSWQIVCHVSEVSRAGDYVAFEFFGQRGFVVRDEAGTLRAFHNVCAHRAHAVVAGERRQLREVSPLQLPRLDLSPGRPQSQRQRTRLVSEIRSLAVRSQAHRAGDLHGHGVHSLPRRRAERGGAHAAAPGRARALPHGADGAARRSVGAGSRHRLEERGGELRRGLPLSPGPSRSRRR